jgi:hypothetical protein
VKKYKDEVIAFPEVSVSTRKDKEGPQERWTVKGGLAERGEAWTDFVNHTIQVPLVNDDTAKVVRGHELVHSHISPMSPEALEAWAEVNGLSPEVIMSAEEFRVNQVLQKIGYDTNLLLDGSEKSSGIRLAKDGSERSHEMAILAGSALVGTKGFRHFINGVRSVNKEWATELRNMELEMLRITKKRSASWIGDTTPDNGLPLGFTRYAEEIALVITKYLNKENEGDWAKGLEGFGEHDKRTGSFAQLRIDNKKKLTVQVKGQLFKRKKAKETGKRIAYPSRILTDPQKRIFSQKPKNSGGIVVIDLSGSMSLSISQVEALVEASPGAYVIGYSHQRRTKNTNAWVLADRGKRVSDLKHVNAGNGNGVDGPVLAHAISKRRGSEPIIWVCDGLVTTSEDGYSRDLAYLCAELVKRHKIVIAQTPEEAVSYLTNPSRKPRLRSNYRYGVINILLDQGYRQ